MSETRTAIRAAVKARHPKPYRSDADRARLRRRVATTGLATTLALAGVWGWSATRYLGDRLRPTDPTLTGTLRPMSPGHTTFTLSGMYLEAAGKKIEILEVEPLASSNIEFLGAIATWPRDLTVGGGLTEGGPGYPTAELEVHHEAVGIEIPAAETRFLPPGHDRPAPVVVSAGFRLRSGDVGAVNGVLVTYRVDGRTRHELFRYAVIGCVKPNPCEAPKDGPSDFAEDVLHRFGLVPVEK